MDFELRGGFDLLGERVDEEADPYAGRVQPADGGLELSDAPGHVEAPLGGDFAAVLGHEAYVLGHDPQGDLEDFRGIPHFEVQFRDDRRAQALDVAVLDVTPVRPQVNRDAVRARAFAERGGHAEVRLRANIVPGRVACLSQGGDVVDIDPELQKGLAVH